MTIFEKVKRTELLPIKMTKKMTPKVDHSKKAPLTLNHEQIFGLR
jgi:hypothetical protein